MPSEPHDMLHAVQRVAAREGRFPYQAYLFVFQSLGKSQELAGEERHVTGAELCVAAQHTALDLFGPLTLMVFDSWNLSQTRDIGEIVFHLVESGLMGKTEEDRLDDFADVYDFQEVFAPENALAHESPRLGHNQRFALGDVPIGSRDEVSRA